jgi:hypothetical protein
MNAPVTLATTAATNPDLSNEKSYDADRRKLFNQATSIGKEGGTGARSLAKLAKVALLGTYESLFSLNKPTPGASGSVAKDDATRLYDAYVKGYSEKDAHGSVTQQVSKLRAFMKVGVKRDIDAVDEFNRWSKMWAEARDAESAAKRKTTLPEYHALCACATAQIAEGQKGELTDDQIDSAIRKAEAKEETFKSLIEAAHKKLEKAIGMRADDNAEEAARLLDALLGFLAVEEEAVAAAEEEEKERAVLAALQAKYAAAAE